MRINAKEFGCKKYDGVADIEVNVNIVLQAVNVEDGTKSVTVTMSLQESEIKNIKDVILHSVEEIKENLVVEAKIKGSAFSKCTNITGVEIGDGVTSIDNGAFFGCKNLADVTIPASVTSIGDRAFNECTSLTSVTYLGTKEEWRNTKKGSYIFTSAKGTEVIDKDRVTFTVDQNGNIIE